MMKSNRTLVGALVAAALLAPGGSARPAAAQSLFASRGLGYLNSPLEGRARGLGGVGTGLPGANLSLVNPAGIAGIPAPAILVSFQPDFYSSDVGESSGRGSTARFPLIQVAAPFGTRVAVSAGYGTFLDQSWSAERQDTLRFAGRRPIPVTDRFIARGGVARLRLGGAYSVGERLAFGAGVDVFTGSLRDTLTRTMVADTSLVGTYFVASRTGTEFGYRGVGGSVGARWSPVEALNLGAAVSFGGTLRARPTGDSASRAGLAGKEYSLPLTVNAGASGRVSPGALVALSGEWARWSAADADLAAAGGARDSWTLAGGVEWDGSREDRTSFPVRVGARYSTLPFRWQASGGTSDFPTERAVTAGIGGRIAGGAALIDLAGERGWRGGSAAGLDERYWRLTASLALLGR